MQAQISHSKWPSTFYGPRVAEQFKFLYQNVSLNYARYIAHDIRSNDTRGAGAEGSQIIDYIEDNILKVQYLFVFEYAILFKIFLNVLSNTYTKQSKSI